MEESKEKPSSEAPLISVIVPVYNVEPYIRQCLDSIISQTYQNLEIILIDDGSPDNCGTICDEYARSDKRIKVLHKENGGLSSARNVGLKVAHGEYLGFVDSDDWIARDMFEYLLRNILLHSADIAACGRIEVHPQYKKAFGWRKTEVCDKAQAIEHLVENKSLRNYMWDKLWKRKLFEEVEFPEGRTFEDISVAHKLFAKADKIVCLTEPKYYYRQRTDGIVGSKMLKNEIDHFMADVQRHEDMCEQWPQYAQMLEARCVEDVVNIWRMCGFNSRSERKRYMSELKYISEWMKTIGKEVKCSADLGITGKITLWLCNHTGWWSFSLSKLLTHLYFLKHSPVKEQSMEADYERDGCLYIT